MMVSSRTEHPKEAAAFARFLISKDMQKLRHEITLTLPAVNIEVDEKVDGFIEQLEYSQPMSNAPQVNLYWSCGTEFCKNVLAGKDPEAELEHFRAALRGDISAEESSTQE